VRANWGKGGKTCERMKRESRGELTEKMIRGVTGIGSGGLSTQEGLIARRGATAWKGGRRGHKEKGMGGERFRYDHIGSAAKKKEIGE